MGFFLSRPWQDEETHKEYRFCVAWGPLTRDAKTFAYRKTKVEFGIRTYRKNFLNIVAWSDSPCFNLVAGLEAGDVVFVAGIQQSDEYTNKDGERKTKTYVNADFVVPLSLMSWALATFASPSLQGLVRADANAPADPMESGDDAYDENYDPFAKQEDDYEPSI